MEFELETNGETLIIQEEYKDYDDRFCGCCGDEIQKLAKLPIEKILEGTNNQGMKDIIQAKTINDLGEKGKELVEWCIDFLLLQQQSGWTFPKKIPTQGGIVMDYNKYITIWSFVYDFLGISKASAYDYWLLCFIENNGLMEHGAGIRCGWWCGQTHKVYGERQVSDKRKEIITQWAKNAPDNI